MEVEPTRAIEAPRGRATRLLRTFGPWVIAGLIVFAILRRVEPAEIAKAVRAGHVGRVVPVAIGWAIAQLITSSLADWFIVRSILPSLRWRDVAPVKAGVSTVQSIAWVATQGAYAAWIARATGIGIRNAAGVFLAFGLCDWTAGTIVISGALWIAHPQAPRFFYWLAPLCFVGLISFLTWLRRQPLDPHGEAGVVRVLRAIPRRAFYLSIAARTATATVVFTTTWAAARGFGMTIPFPVVAAYVPLLLLIGSLPISVGGFGAVQGAWLVFTPWAPASQILAFQFIWNLLQMAGQVCRGLPFVKRVVVGVTSGATHPRVVASTVAQRVDPGD
jgi:hypothetical protein